MTNGFEIQEGAEKSVHSVLIQAYASVIWHELTKIGDVSPCFFGSVRDCAAMAAGEAFAMRSPSGKITSVIGEILELSLNERYVHSFKFTTLNDPACLVIHDLTPEAGGIRYTLTSVFQPSLAKSKTAKQMTGGGAFITKTLKALCETGRPHFGGRLILGIIGFTEFLSPKRSYSEHWPLKDIPDHCKLS